MTYYHRFYIESLYSENRRWILRWLFRTFPVYLFETTPAGYKGRFYTQNIRFPKAAFRDLTFSLQGDRSLCLWIISYDLHTLYFERNIYVLKEWYYCDKLLLCCFYFVLFVCLAHLFVLQAFGADRIKTRLIDCRKFALDEKLFIYSLQGMLNRNSPELFLICEDSWQSKTADRDWYHYLKDVKRIEFDTLSTFQELSAWALRQLDIQGLTLYDPAAIDGQETIVALNKAALFGSLPVTDRLLKSLSVDTGKLPVEDIRGQWKTPVEAIKYYVGELMPLTTQKSAFSYGYGQKSRGQGGLDYAIAKKMLIYKIDIRDKAEHSYFIDVMNHVKAPAAIYGGWYTEGQDVNFGYSSGGNYALLSDAACSNLSLLAAIPANTNLSFTQRKHNLVLDPTKYYVLLQVNEGDTYKWVSTFMNRLWKDPKRGSFPIAWGIPPEIIDDIPVMLEYYRQTATDNDSFFAAPSGAGYIWPNHTPKEKYKLFAAYTDHYMDRLGLQAVDVWGFSWIQNFETRALSPHTKLISGEVCASDLDAGSNLWLDDGQLIATSPRNLWYEGTAQDLLDFAEQHKPPYFIPVYGGKGGKTMPYEFMETCYELLDDRFVFVGVEDFIDLMEQARKLNATTPAEKRFQGTGIVSLASGKYCCGYEDKACYTGLIACRTVVGKWELFDLVKLKDNTVAFRLKTNGKYVYVADEGEDQILKVNGDTITPASKFRLISHADGSTSIQAVINGKFLTDQNFAIPMRLEKRNNSINQKFRIEVFE